MVRTGVAWRSRAGTQAWCFRGSGLASKHGLTLANAPA